MPDPDRLLPVILIRIQLGVKIPPIKGAYPAPLVGLCVYPSAGGLCPWPRVLSPCPGVLEAEGFDLPLDHRHRFRRGRVALL